VALGVLFDLTHWAQIATKRQNAQSLYQQYAPGGMGG
jgi:hypothetical protein